MFHMVSLEPVDYLVIGHITVDLTPSGPALGGSAAYAALTARALGLRVGIVTVRGNEIPLTALDGNGLAWGAGVETLVRLRGPVHALLALYATTEREQPIGPAQVGYMRPALALGPVLALGRGRLRWQLGATGQAGMLLMRGKGLATAHRTTSAEMGAGAFLRVLLAGTWGTPFVNLGAVTWVGRQRATLDDAPDTAQLPRWDAQLALGVCFSP